MLKKDAEGVAQKTLISIPWGTYYVIPNNGWESEYDSLEDMKNIRLGNVSKYTIEFDRHHKAAAMQPLHDEAHN